MVTNHNATPKKGGFKAAKQNRIFQDIVEQIQEAILEAIKKRKPEQACALVQNHVRRFYEQMLSHNQYVS